MEILIPLPAKISTLVKDKQRSKIRALSPSQIINRHRIIYDFEGRFLNSIGRPEKIAKWFITGPSFSGKSSFTFSLCNYMTRFGVINYNSFEEGDSETVKSKIMDYGLQDKDGLIKFLPGEPIADFKIRMMRRNAASFGVIDSVQHSGMNKAQYLDLVDTLCKPKKGKSLLFINHWIKNDFSKFIKHDSDIKIEIIGFVAHIESRYGGNEPFVIWEEEARKRWGKKYQQIIQGRYWPGQKK